MFRRNNIIWRSLLKHLLLLATCLGSLSLGNILSKADSQDHLRVNLYLIQSDSNLKKYGKRIIDKAIEKVKARPRLKFSSEYEVNQFLNNISRLHPELRLTEQESHSNKQQTPSKETRRAEAPRNSNTSRPAASLSSYRRLSKDEILANIKAELEKSDYDAIKQFKDDFINRLHSQEIQLNPYRDSSKIPALLFRELQYYLKLHPEMIYHLDGINLSPEVADSFVSRLANAYSLDNMLSIVQEARAYGQGIIDTIAKREEAKAILTEHRNTYKERNQRVGDDYYSTAFHEIDEAITIQQLNKAIAIVENEAYRVRNKSFDYNGRHHGFITLRKIS
ncbi:TPA: hypothetical protein TUM69_001607 [Streptococcus equi subsp. zooepidemicus]|uniref:hypothetical protein n=1 Tax=Streptococcus equi TaxID=1336 RepID=UPI001E328E11|nr:hypothetical protein [Streptococcus equi]MCD3415358.1 hypothetical protein [Streptococcus equi subsp. zooepidemicus]MCD3428542.1 hypothetical protein [Streptococcus equi subsp. zooepidemicus]MCD3463600.1 hypothetical protein [Streptococcus equi subsp. zooepidemicus]MDI5914181.1 hypothetical protein [Streptococcus equi subsp. zooepidemicus]HEL0415037.1 hypothetical protein [Streptococcus equi subsp. zooepidemicus]